MIPFEYHWDDIGAPPLNTNAGSILEIFKACLITGYGSKAGAGWKLQYDGWTTKGEQKLAFSVGDEQEQELIYWLNDTVSSSTALSLWGGLNAEKDYPLGEAVGNNHATIKHHQGFKEWHCYATKRFCLFLWEVKKEGIQYYNHEGSFVLFGAVKDLFGEFLPQVIIGANNSNTGNIRRNHQIISSGGEFLLPKHPFSDNENYENHNQSLYQHSAIEYYLPTLCAYSPTKARYSYNLRLHIPSIVICCGSYLTDYENNDWFKVVEKNGSKIVRFCGYYNRYLGFDINEWDSPVWLNQIING